MANITPSSRMEWEIKNKGSRWFARHIDTDAVLYARSKSRLMSKINAFDKQEDI
ncbi:hypothetical protein [Neptuniibacter sp. QD37_11]|uniref:hypothetical protein n=1 Tax=Neptuniibacter sp. QD37_11 TaxID=3398209 RepID=UPI0039F53EF6